MIGIGSAAVDAEGQLIMGRLGQVTSIETIKCAFRCHACSRCDARVSQTCDFRSLDAGMEQAKDAEIEGGVDERPRKEG
jgi:hypothetical protein